MKIPPPGDYVAKLSGRIVIYEAASKALCAAIPCVISQGEHIGFTTKGNALIAKADGTLNENSIANLKTIFGWDGVNPFDLADNDYAAAQFALAQCTHEEYEGKTYFKPGWVNPLGGGMKMPEPADRKSILARHGAKFRALAGTAKATPAKPATAPTAPKPPASAPPPEVVTESTENEAWVEFEKDNVGKSDEDIARLWFADLKKLFPGRDKNTFTPQEWGKVKDSIGPGF